MGVDKVHLYNQSFIDYLEKGNLRLDFCNKFFKYFACEIKSFSADDKSIIKIKEMDDMKIVCELTLNHTFWKSSYYSGSITITYLDKTVLKFGTKDPVYSIKGGGGSSPKIYSSVAHHGAFKYNFMRNKDALKEMDEKQPDLLNWIRLTVR